MHSRKKRLVPPTPEELAAEKQRLDKIHRLHKLVFTEIESGCFTDEGLSLSQKAMSISPDIYTFLNFRRKILLDKLSTCSEDEKLKLLTSELDLLTKIIKESPKSYTLWFHRQWVLRQSKDIAAIMQRELALCDYMLKKDNRNFHVWNFRSWVVELEGNQGVNEEMEFTKAMIFRDFSNFSAWHYRTKVVKRMFVEVIPEEFIKSELAMLKNAYFTCPNDQSVWNYHRWLLLSQESIKVVGFSPRTYTVAPDRFLVGFSHSVSGVDSEAIAVSDGWEAVEGTWEPLFTKPFSYIWSFTPSRPIQFALEIRLSPLNRTIVDVNQQKLLSSLIYKYKKSGEVYEIQADGTENTEIFEQELSNINELLDIEEDDTTQVLIRKAQICEVLYFAVPGSSYCDSIIDCYTKLIVKDPRHLKFYEAELQAFRSLKDRVKPAHDFLSQKLNAKVLGLV